MPIHTDPETQAVACRNLQRRVNGRCLLLLALVGVMAIFIAWAIWKNLRLWCVNGYAFITRMNYPLLYIPIVTATCLIDILPLRRIVRQLSTGVPLEHGGKSWPLRSWLGILVILACAGILLCVWNENTPDVTQSELPEVPYVMLAELGGEQTDDGFVNHVDGFLADVWVIREGKGNQVDTPRRESDGWDVFYWKGKTCLYRTKLPGLSKALMSQIMNNEPNFLPRESVSGTIYDEAVYGENGSEQVLLLRDGRSVLWVQMDGITEKLKDHTAEFEPLLQMK